MSVCLPPLLTDVDLIHLDTLCESYMELAVKVFGKERFWNRIKFHVPAHVAEMIKRLGSIPYNDESQL